jgi:hypothetical protein
MTTSTLSLHLKDGDNNPEYVKVIFSTLVQLIGCKQQGNVCMSEMEVTSRNVADSSS